MDWIEEHPANGANVKETSKKRRSHTKSRLGCRACRGRRIKCDETHPECSNCIKHGLRCSYLDTQRPTPVRRSTSVSSQHSGVELVGAREQILQQLRDANIPAQGTSSPYQQSDTAEILDHFLDDSELWIGTPEIQRVAQTYELIWAVDAPYLMHAILAGSANHLYSKNPDVEKYEVAGNEHYALSLNAFRKQLDKPITRSNMDALIGCSILHGPLAFWRQAYDQDAGNHYEWLRAIKGVPAIIASLADPKWLEQSEWYTYSKEAGGSVRSDIVLPSDPVIRPWARDVTRRLEQLCQVSVDDEDESSPYVAALRHLSKLLHMNEHHKRSSATLRFIGHLQTSYLRLLDAGDARALLIFCYWYGLMCNVKQWWSDKPAVMGCTQLCRTLAQCDDKAVIDMLDWPRMQVGLQDDA